MINDMSKNSVSSEQGGSGRDFANQLLAKYVKTAMAAQETSDETPRQFLKKKTSVSGLELPPPPLSLTPPQL